MNSSNREIVDIDKRNKSFLEINQKAFKELLTFIDFADEKLNIAFAEINFAQNRDLLIEKLIEHPDCKDIQFEILDFSDPNLRFVRDELIAALKNIQIAPDKKLILLIIGLEKSIGVLDQYPDVLVNLNFVRDDLSRTVPHPMLLFLPDYALTRLAKYAPDFWSWNRKVFYFKSVKSNLESIGNETIFVENSKKSNLSAIKERIDLLECLLSEYRYYNKSKDNFNAITTINLYTQLGIAYSNLGKYQRAITLFNQSLKIAQKIQAKSGEGGALNNLGNAYHCIGEYQQAIELFEKSLAINKQIDDLSGQARSLNNLGIVYHCIGEYQQVIDFHQKSLAIQQQIGDLSGQASSSLGLGNIYYSTGEYQRAIDLYQQSLTIEQKIENINGEASSLTGLGNAYASLGEYQQAIDFHQKSLAIQQQIGNRCGEASSLNNLGIAYAFLGEYQQAIDLYKQSLTIEQQIGDRGGEAKTWLNLGHAHAYLRQILEAKIAYEKARKLYQVMKLNGDVEYCNRAIQELENEN